MAGIVERAFSYQVNVSKGGSPRNLVSVVGFNTGGTKQIDLTTNASGEFANVQEIIAQSYSVTLVDTVATTENNPFEIRFLKYEDRFFAFGKNFTGPSTDAVFLQNDDVITESNQLTVQGYTGITFVHTPSSEEIQLTGGTWNKNRLYDRCKDEAELNPQPANLTFIDSVDGVNFTQTYDISVSGITFDALGGAYSGDWTLLAAATDGDFTNGTVNNLTVQTGGVTTLTDANVTGLLTLPDAGPYTLDGCQINDLTVLDAGPVTINLLNGSTVSGTVTGNVVFENPVTLTIRTVETDGTPVDAVRVRVVAGATGPLAPGTVIIAGDLTNAQGEVSDSATYVTDQEITGVARKSSPGDVPKYQEGPIVGTIDSNAGATVTVVMIPDE